MHGTRPYIACKYHLRKPGSIDFGILRACAADGDGKRSSKRSCRNFLQPKRQGSQRGHVRQLSASAQGLLELTQLDIYEMARSKSDAARLLDELYALHSREVGWPLRFQLLAAHILRMSSFRDTCCVLKAHQAGPL